MLRSRKQFVGLVGFFLASIGAAVLYAHNFPEQRFNAKIWGSLIGAFVLGFFGLGGNEMSDERMRSHWWFVIPRYEYLPFVMCFLLGTLLFEMLASLF